MFPHLILQISAFFNDHVLFDVAHVLNGGTTMKKIYIYICIEAGYCALYYKIFLFELEFWGKFKALLDASWR